MEKSLQACPGGGGRDARLQAAIHFDESFCPKLASWNEVFILIDGQPNLSVLQTQAWKSLRRYADDNRRTHVDPDSAPHYIGVFVKRSAPELVAQDDHRTSIRTFLDLLGEHPTKRRAVPQFVEPVGGNMGAFNVLVLLFPPSNFIYFLCQDR